jgi:crossover junction endodeoxyribonuclease RusA
MLLSFKLPWPPSANTYWRRNGDRYFISQKGKDYRNTTILLCKKYQDAFSKDQRLRVAIEAYPPDNRRRDIDNICKCLLDSLQHAKVYPDDSQIDELIITRKPHKYGEVFITIDDVF